MWYVPAVDGHTYTSVCVCVFDYMRKAPNIPELSLEFRSQVVIVCMRACGVCVCVRVCVRACVLPGLDPLRVRLITRRSR